MKEYISAEEKAKQILKEINKDSPYTETRELSQKWILACIAKGLQEFALGKDSPLMIIYKVVLSTAKRVLKENTEGMEIKPSIKFEEPDASGDIIKYEIVSIDKSKQIHTIDNYGVHDKFSWSITPDKTIIELADYIRSHTN